MGGENTSACVYNHRQCLFMPSVTEDLQKLTKLSKRWARIISIILKRPLDMWLILGFNLSHPNISQAPNLGWSLPKDPIQSRARIVAWPWTFPRSESAVDRSPELHLEIHWAPRVHIAWKPEKKEKRPLSCRQPVL